tara:strand:+ start:322 stop:1209 length:888 start_codon:yes stop_codon:yes gene_type:complete
MFVLLVVFLLVFYWFIPFNTTEFYEYSSDLSSNFSLNSQEGSMQFYDNMRYPSSNITYKIHDCPLYKQNDIEQSFGIISNLTILNFSSVSDNEDISALCDDRGGFERGLFIAGEGGPMNITRLENFNVIFQGEILLIKETNCDKPIVGMHEIFHALGFGHSPNKKNIMYDVSRCDQEVGEDIINKINELYSYPSYPDLSFENISAVMNGKYLDVSLSVRNNGLSNSEKAKVIIYADEKSIKEVELDPLAIGHGTKITLGKIWVPKINVFELKFVIDYESFEIEKTNNEKKLEIKN